MRLFSDLAKLADVDKRFDVLGQLLDDLRTEVRQLSKDVDTIRLPALELLDKVSRRLAGRVNKQLEREAKAAEQPAGEVRLPRTTVFGRR
jgi:hypothetical protein